eukprot:gnl/MRDRNA2_/MRDRNA2_29827_c0_seq1.p1 gnl/MRDRNA2_/MRDRNA2_29827_c0~~gnl/MRDRNA2_/MRDRNA2_29827_c0_seq1.p1  ORF type:complete len:542 (-),score=131.39 gnl/MRDRNA2_/MRDRNA2_29827_c0_seq1:123-1748(-)
MGRLLVTCEDHTLEIGATSARTIEAISWEVQNSLGIAKDEYHFHDIYGPVTEPEDLARALQMAGTNDCVLKVVYHAVFARLRGLMREVETLKSKVGLQDQAIQDSEARAAKALEDTTHHLSEMIGQIDIKFNEQTQTVARLCKDSSSMQMEMQSINMTLRELDIKELKELMESAKVAQLQVQDALNRVTQLERSWEVEKEMMMNDIEDQKKDLANVQKSIAGKIDVCIEADADLSREMRLVSEKCALNADDVTLIQEEMKKVVYKCQLAMEQSLESKTLLSGVREDSAKVLADSNMLKERVHCLEGVAADKWPDFAPGVVFCRRFHQEAKGGDVQLNGDHCVATGRGFSSLQGVVIGNDEGLVMGNGPCRRTGKPGKFVSYFEIEITEVYANAEGCGGLYLGASVQSAEQVLEHPRKEFDGWLIGGKRSAFVQIRGAHGKLFSNIRPASKASEIIPMEAAWNSEVLRVGDRVGALMMLKREGGMVMRIVVNGTVTSTEVFSDAPPEDQCQFFTPVVRIAGTAKSVRICPGLDPPKYAMEDF